MNRSLTHEQSYLCKAAKLLTDFSSVFNQRLLVLEAYAANNGGFDVEEYWTTFGIKVSKPEIIKSIAKKLSIVLSITDIPASLVLSSLAREPISISDKKQNGVFYTDFRLAQFVAKDCRDTLDANSKVADIAAGSGILLAAIAELYYERFPKYYDKWIAENVYAFDLSENALRGARIALAVHAKSVDAIRRMCSNWLICDSLLTDDTHFPKFDIIVGNPPWGKVKLSLHSFINKSGADYHIYGSGYGDFDRDKFLSERQNTLNYSKILKERYSLLENAEPDMYMAFLQRAIAILKPQGHLSYIVPAGLIRSLGTESLRRFLINCSEGLKYYLLDNKANFFEIDSRFKFVIVSQNKARPEEPGCKQFAFEICKSNKKGLQKSEEIVFSAEELERHRPDMTIPECRSVKEKELFVKICEHGRLWKDKWRVDIAREIDMTNDRARFHVKQSNTDIPVIEGRMVQQFRFGAKAYVSGSGRSAKWSPSVGSVKAQFFISPASISERLKRRVNTFRAGYCDIAGQTNERAMMSAAIPAGVVCGNKVPTIIFPGEDGENRLYFFVGVTNSFVFDWILRRVLSTTVNYFLLFSLPMPNIDLNSTLASKIISLSKQLSNMGKEYYTNEIMGEIRAELDIAVAEAYSLDFSDLELILQDFPLLDRNQPAINGEPRSTFTRDLLLSKAEKCLWRGDEHYSSRARAGAELGALAYIPTEMVELSKGDVT